MTKNKQNLFSELALLPDLIKATEYYDTISNASSVFPLLTVSSILTQIRFQTIATCKTFKRPRKSQIGPVL